AHVPAAWLGRVPLLLLACGIFRHGLDEAIGPHIGPMLVYVFKAGRSSVRSVNDRPPRGHRDEARPQGMLPLVIDQNVVDAVLIFKRIGHVLLLGTMGLRAVPFDSSVSRIPSGKIVVVATPFCQVAEGGIRGSIKDKRLAWFGGLC